MGVPFKGLIRQTSTKLLFLRKLCIPMSQDSVFGKRDGALTGIAVVHQERSNIYRKSSLWKTGVITDVTMLERASMFKPEAPIGYVLFHILMILKFYSWDSPSKTTFPILFIGFPF